jgi:cellulose synthase/poly-beta-1,6-N-acetylglucosamine synthase-like glycosyltransferase
VGDGEKARRMTEQLLYYLAVACAVSFVWMVSTSQRPHGEHPFVGGLHLFGIVLVTTAVYAVWRREPGLALAFGLAHGLLVTASWAPLPDWNSRGRAFFVSFGAAQFVFLARILWAIVFGGLGPAAIAGSLVLFTAESIAVALTIYFAYEVLDVMCRLRWRRHFPPHTGPNDYWPKVSIHVPAHAEPAEMVIETLTALRNLDYPNYEVIMVDDNTDDDRLWRPVVDFCYRAGFKVFHLQDYPGFKSGALNFALRQSAPETEVIAVVDSDYVVEPQFLRQTIPYFRNPRVAFLQTPQAFRNDHDNLFAHRSALAQRFFFEIGMRSRNESNAIIFCGTMGLIRKRALERIGGWDEWCITEDAEASLRLLSKGYESVFINRAYGHGLLPTAFLDTKKQRFRWAFGGIQILKRYWRWLIPRFGQSSGLSARQRLAYLAGSMGWFNDLLTLIFTLFLLLTTAAFFAGWTLPVRRLTEWILLVPVLSITTGTLRVGWALRRTTGCSWSHGVGAFLTMLSMSWTVAQACLSALWHDRGVFLRTPKFAVESSLTRALRAARWESILGILLAAAVPLTLYVRTDREGVLLALLLAWHSLIYLSALRSALIEALPVRRVRPEPAAIEAAA